MTEYHRVLIKLSGEVFGGGAVGVDPDVVAGMAHELAEVVRAGVQVSIVVGGGNFFRGLSSAQRGMDRASADYAGMLGTVLNALSVQDACERLGVFTRVMSAIEIQEVAEPYIRRRAIRHLEKGRVVIFAAGTGNPFFTTDTCAALRATELACDVLLKATKVDGVYTADPRKDKTATRYEQLTFAEALAKGLRVMDMTALAMCGEHKLPVVVFDFKKPGNIAAVVRRESIGTLVTP